MDILGYDVSAIKFPIATFTSGNSIFLSRKLEQITVCTKVSFKNEFYNDLQIVDSVGFLYQVQRADKVGTVGPFWGYNIFFNQKIKVNLLIKNRSVSLIKLEEFKLRILDIINGDDSFWNADGLIDKRIIFIETANSHAEIIEHLSYEFYFGSK